MKIGITYDIKEQYGFTSLDLNFTDFLNVADVSFAKEELEKCGHEVFLLGNAQQMIRFLYKGIIINHNKKPSQPTLKRRYFFVKSDVFLWPGLRKEW